MSKIMQWAGKYAKREALAVNGYWPLDSIQTPWTTQVISISLSYLLF